MMNLLSKYKNIIIGLVVVGGGFFVYSAFFTENPSGPLMFDNVDPTQAVVEQELIALLLELRSIRLDLSIFDDAEFQSLQDFSQELVAEPVGRPNPFLPLQ